MFVYKLYRACITYTDFSSVFVHLQVFGCTAQSVGSTSVSFCVMHRLVIVTDKH